MRMILPPIKDRRVVDRLLSAFFRQYRAGDFKKAIATVEKTFQLARDAGRNDIASMAQERLALYRIQQPYRQKLSN